MRSVLVIATAATLFLATWLPVKSRAGAEEASSLVWDSGSSGEELTVAEEMEVTAEAQEDGASSPELVRLPFVDESPVGNEAPGSTGSDAIANSKDAPRAAQPGEDKSDKPDKSQEPSDGNAGTADKKVKSTDSAETKQTEKKPEEPKPEEKKPAEKKPEPPTYPSVKLNGVFQADAGWFHQDAASRATYGELRDGADFRRARLSGSGAISDQINYFLQMDFGFFGRPTFTDLWVEQTAVPHLGTVRVGQWKQPFSLEVVSSFRYTTFMERSVLFQPFTPFRHIGAGFYNHSDDLRRTWAFSGFRSGQDQFGGSLSTDGGWGTSTRLTWLPFWDEASEGCAYMHLGLGHFFSNPPFDLFNFRTIPEMYIGDQAPGLFGTSLVPSPGVFNGTPFFVATGPLDMQYGYHVTGGELLWVEGPFSLQAEAMVSFMTLKTGEYVALPGYYAQVGYFLTGEHRPYKRETATIERVIPYSDWHYRGKDCCGKRGHGAWEVAFRVSQIDLNSGSVRGGQLTDLTTGVNWYTSAYTKVVFNWVHAFSDHPTGGRSDTDLFGVRAQMDF